MRTITIMSNTRRLDTNDNEAQQSRKRNPASVPSVDVTEPTYLSVPLQPAMPMYSPFASPMYQAMPMYSPFASSMYPAMPLYSPFTYQPTYPVMYEAQPSVTTSPSIQHDAQYTDTEKAAMYNEILRDILPTQQPTITTNRYISLQAPNALSLTNGSPESFAIDAQNIREFLVKYPCKMRQDTQHLKINVRFSRDCLQTEIVQISNWLEKRYPYFKRTWRNNDVIIQVAENLEKPSNINGEENSAKPSIKDCQIVIKINNGRNLPQLVKQWFYKKFRGSCSFKDEDMIKIYEELSENQINEIKNYLNYHKIENKIILLVDTNTNTSGTSVESTQTTSQTASTNPGVLAANNILRLTNGDPESFGNAAQNIRDFLQKKYPCKISQRSKQMTIIVVFARDCLQTEIDEISNWIEIRYPYFKRTWCNDNLIAEGKGNRVTIASEAGIRNYFANKKTSQETIEGNNSHILSETNAVSNPTTSQNSPLQEVSTRPTSPLQKATIFNSRNRNSTELDEIDRDLLKEFLDPPFSSKNP